MKKTLRILLVAVLTGTLFLSTAVSALAETDSETGKTVYSDLPAMKYIQDDGSLTIIEYYGGNSYKKIVIPNAISDPVSEIRSGAFLGADPSKVDAVYLPDTLMKIGKDAFQDGMRIVVYRAGDYRAFASDGQRTNKDPDVSKLTVKTDTVYGKEVVADGIKYRLDGMTATVSGYQGSGGEVRVASEVSSLPVTTVETGALTDASITKLYLPSNVTSVEENAVGAFEVVFRADTDTPVIPSETPIVPESRSSVPETGSAEIGTFDMSLEEFVTTEAESKEEDPSDDETEEPSEEASNQGQKGGSEGAKGETKSAEESGEPEENMTDPETDEPSDGNKPGPWLYVGIGAGIVAAAGIAMALVALNEKKKRSRRNKRRNE